MVAHGISGSGSSTVGQKTPRVRGPHNPGMEGVARIFMSNAALVEIAGSANLPALMKRGVCKCYFVSTGRLVCRFHGLKS